MISNIINRELSWLSFNERVLLEAADTANPLLERARFLSIFSSNLDEFFMVRVSSIYEQISSGYNEKDASGYTATALLERVITISHRLLSLQQSIFNQLKEELAAERIFFPDINDPEFEDVLESIFINEIVPVISPVIIDSAHPFPFIYGRRICIIVQFERHERTIHSLIVVPDTLKRAYKISKGRSINVFKIEDIIRKYIGVLYKGYHIEDVSYFRVTRDADLEVIEEESVDFIKSMEHSLHQRKRGNVNRVEISKGMDAEMVNFLKLMVGFTDMEVEIVDGTIDLTFMSDLAGINRTLMFEELAPRPIKRVADMRAGDTLFSVIRRKPLYFFRPYNSFSVLPTLVAQAATDENVLAIKMTIYRMNRDPKILAALLEAAKRGKQVSVVVELKARFDEERNIGWAKNLEQAGCTVTYGLVGLKIHAKCMLIVRKEDDKIVRYTHLATGNYNEITANIYTDVDVITSEEAVGREATKLFNYLTGFTEDGGWDRLTVAPFDMRDKINFLINSEIVNAKAGRKAAIIMKVNSLIDENIIARLYEASSAGVKVQLIVRGVCGLMPGIKGLSENITVKSIVGRFLEHARILYFENGGDPEYYITSADMMQRNLDRRVELMISIEDIAFRKSLKHYLDVALKDNCKAWEMKGALYCKVLPDDGAERLNSQEYFLTHEI